MDESLRLCLVFFKDHHENLTSFAQSISTQKHISNIESELIISGDSDLKGEIQA